MEITHAVYDGNVTQPCVFPVTWDWYDDNDNPIPLSVFVTISDCCQAVQNFSFSRWPVPPPPPLTGNYSLGYISFNITVAAPGFCNVTIPKLLMDGAFKVLIDDTLVPSILTWNTTHTFIHFTHPNGTHNVKIVGEMVTTFRGLDLLTLCDVNGDGIVDIYDIVKLGAVYGYKEYP